MVTPSGQHAASTRRRGVTEDDLLAFLLIHTWTLTTGRILRSDVPPADLSAAELIAFWADEQTAGPDTAVASACQAPASRMAATRMGRR